MKTYGWIVHLAGKRWEDIGIGVILRQIYGDTAERNFDMSEFMCFWT